MTNRCERMRGFTLMELLMTVVVAGILTTIAVPSFRTYVQDSRLSQQAETLVYSLNLARSEAVKLDTQVAVCSSSDGATCTGSNWASGWIVCYPASACPNGAGVGTPIVAQASPALADGNTADELVSGATTVTYSSTGQTGNAYEFVFCDSRGASDGREVEVNSIGRIEAAQTAGDSVAGTALPGC